MKTKKRTAPTQGVNGRMHAVLHRKTKRQHWLANLIRKIKR
jgi:hypothetical protein